MLETFLEKLAKSKPTKNIHMSDFFHVDIDQPRYKSLYTCKNVKLRGFDDLSTEMLLLQEEEEEEGSSLFTHLESTERC